MHSFGSRRVTVAMLGNTITLETYLLLREALRLVYVYVYIYIYIYIDIQMYLYTYMCIYLMLAGE